MYSIMIYLVLAVSILFIGGCGKTFEQSTKIAYDLIGLPLAVYQDTERNVEISKCVLTVPATKD